MQKDSSKPPLHPPLHNEQAGDPAGANALGNDGARNADSEYARSHVSRALVHDLRNAVAPIRNAVHLLRFRCRDDPNLTQITDIIDRQVSEIVRLLNSPEAAAHGRQDLKSAADVPFAPVQNPYSKVPKP
jgi:signal transduction histidine kinase